MDCFRLRWYFWSPLRCLVEFDAFSSTIFNIVRVKSIFAAVSGIKYARLYWIVMMVTDSRRFDESLYPCSTFSVQIPEYLPSWLMNWIPLLRACRHINRFFSSTYLSSLLTLLSVLLLAVDFNLVDLQKLCDSIWMWKWLRPLLLDFGGCNQCFRILKFMAMAKPSPARFWFSFWSVWWVMTNLLSYLSRVRNTSRWKQEIFCLGSSRPLSKEWTLIFFPSNLLL